MVRVKLNPMTDIEVNLLKFKQNVRNRTAERTNGDGLIRCEMNSSTRFFACGGWADMRTPRIENKVEKQLREQRAAGQGSSFC